MAHRTELFQKPGSPLIQGHSKVERSFWGEWLLGLALCLFVAFGIYVYLGLDPQAPFGVSDLSAAARLAFLHFGPGAVLGAALGVSLARGFGWRRQWQAAAIVGLICGGLSAWILSGVGL